MVNKLVEPVETAFIPRVTTQVARSVNSGSDSGSIKSTSSVVSKEKKVYDRLAVFMGLLSTHPVLDIKDTMVNFRPAELTYHVK